MVRGKPAPVQCLCSAARTWRCLMGEQPVPPPDVLELRRAAALGIEQLSQREAAPQQRWFVQTSMGQGLSSAAPWNFPDGDFHRAALVLALVVTCGRDVGAALVFRRVCGSGTAPRRRAGLLLFSLFFTATGRVCFQKCRQALFGTNQSF